MTRRRRRSLPTEITLLLLCCLSSCCIGDAFVFLPSLVRQSTLADLSAIQERKTTTWSRSGETRRGSRFGVRRRVKAVLQKARNRTGLANVHSESSARVVVAEAASIGGFESDSSSFVYRPQRANGTETDLILESSYREETLTVDEEEIDSSGGGGGDQVDAILNSNLPSTVDIPIAPLPFELPRLSAEQVTALQQGERIQEQSKMGREGSGFVVMDVKAPPYIVWESLLDFEGYVDKISTVRAMHMFTNTHLKSSYIAEKPVLPGTGRETRHYGTASITRAKFVLSKFRFNIAAIHRYQPHPDGHYMEFTLDKATSNAVFKDAKGTWYTQTGDAPGLKEGYTRVWLLCSLRVSAVLPRFIVDYAAKRAMPRATTWLKPEVEAEAVRLLQQNGANGSNEVNGARRTNGES